MMHPAATAAGEAPALFHPASSLDFVPPAVLRGLQSQRLRQVVARACEHVPLYRQRMQKRGLTPADVRSPDDLARLPLLTAADLADAYPLGLLAVPIREVVRLHRRGGALGKPTVAAFTRRDLEEGTGLVVRSLAACGIAPGDVVQIACPGDFVAEGLALHAGAEALGAMLVPVPAGDADGQLLSIKDFGASALCCTAGHFLHLVERAAKTGVDLRELPLRAGVLIAEPWTEATRRRIEAAAGIRAYDLWGLPELGGPGVGAECCQQDGLHVFEDHFYPEIVDPQSGQPVADGQEGELVLTALCREAMPIVRFRTGQRTAIMPGSCPCGRTLRRVRRIGRTSGERSVAGGADAVRAQVEAALLAVQGTLPRYRVVLTRDGGHDRAEVQVEVTPQTFSDRVAVMEDLEGRLSREIGHALAVQADVRLVEPHTLGHAPSAAGQVIDQRGEE